MDFINFVIDMVMHLDRHLAWVIENYGIWTYTILFIILFCETGLVITPFLPGDSLLFATGTFAALGMLNFKWLIVILIAGAVLGDTVNYWIGHKIGPRAFANDRSRYLNKKHLERTHKFYEKHGGKTIILARFIPIIRTFAPFVAGVGSMTYARFLAFNVIGGVAWVLILVLCGYFFGNIPVIRRNFTLVIFAIIVISVLPAVIELMRQRCSHTT